MVLTSQQPDKNLWVKLKFLLLRTVKEKTHYLALLNSFFSYGFQTVYVVITVRNGISLKFFVDVYTSRGTDQNSSYYNAFSLV